jgi:hypothetical protein
MWTRPRNHPPEARNKNRPAMNTPLVEGLEQRRHFSGTPALSIGDVALAEGSDGGQTAFVFTVRLSKPSAQQVTVNFATADGTAQSGTGFTTADNDYVATAGTMTFAPGQTAKTVTVLVNADANPETDERFTVNLSGARHASVADPTGAGTIYNDDPPPSGYYIDPILGLVPEQQHYDPYDSAFDDLGHYWY